MNPLCIRELAEIAGGRLRLGCLPPLGGEHEPLGRVTACCDRVQPGDVFWGIETADRNTSWRAEEAFARGALGAVVSGRRLEPWGGKFSLEVDDAQASLWRLAQAMRRRFTGTLVAVVGSGLERVACRAIETVLRGRSEYNTVELEANDESAVAMRLVDLGERDRASVVELRAGAPGGIECLASRCCPHLGVLVGGLETTAEQAQSQAELLAALPQNGFAIANGDDPALRRAVGQTAAQVVWFGSGPHCDIFVSEVECRGGGLALVIDGLPLHMPALGRGQLTAVLAAFAVGRVLGNSPRRIAGALGRYRPAAPTIQETTEEYALTT